MNNQINELKEVLTNNNTTSIKSGIETLNNFFDSFEFHPCKQEWNNMNRDEKRTFVKTLMNYTEEAAIDETESHVSIDEEMVDKVIEVDHQQAVDVEKAELEVELAKLQQRIVDIRSRIAELGGEVAKTSKIDICRMYYKDNQPTRKQFIQWCMDVMKMSKPHSSTYWNTINSSK